MLKIIERTKLWFGISLALIAIGIIFMIVNKGLNEVWTLEVVLLLQ